MKPLRPFTFVLTLAIISLSAVAVFAAATVGQPAPDFSIVDSNGKTHKLSDYKGKFVVLEWHNQGCPYVKKHYGSGNMQRLQKEWTGKGVAWLSILSSAPGKQGFVSAQEENMFLKSSGAAPTAALLDPNGDVGRLYSAKTTPHMIVIDPKGNIIYNGAIDDRPTADPGDIQGASNYVSAALTESMAGKPVSVATTKPYGCTVKYAD
jgi:peroxiredoxin